MSTPITPAAVVAAAASRPRALPRRALSQPAHVSFAQQQRERAAGIEIAGIGPPSDMAPGRYAVQLVGEGPAVPTLANVTAAPDSGLLNVRPPLPASAPTCGTGIGGMWCRLVSWVRGL